jgi:hypothetical protein
MCLLSGHSASQELKFNIISQALPTSKPTENKFGKLSLRTRIQRQKVLVTAYGFKKQILTNDVVHKKEALQEDLNHRLETEITTGLSFNN